MKYGSTNGVRTTVKRFGKELKENMVSDRVKAYESELQRRPTSTEIGDGSLAVTKLLSKKWGRPLLLGKKIDTEVQTILRAMRDSGAVFNTSIAIATSTGVVHK